MHLCRTILVFLIALSVAMLPGSGGGVAVKVNHMDMSHVSSAMDDMDCCPHKNLPSEKTIDDCCSLAACPMNCFGFAGTSSLIVFSMLLLGSVPMPTISNPFHSQTGSPPFRPPRV